MQTACFEMKHAHLAAERFAREEAERVGLTPSRIDMLRAIMTSDSGFGMLQSTLRQRLCVSAPVVSIMVRALEKLGFVKRERAFTDRRTFQISLTERGAAALRRIYYGSIVEPFLELKLKAAFGKTARRFAGGWKKAVGRLETLIREFRAEFGRGNDNPWEVTEDDDLFYHADVPENPNRTHLVLEWNPLWGPTPPCYAEDRFRKETPPPEPLSRRSSIWHHVV
jgi:DNA-binding MarR family transcriptional regulator